MHKAKLIGNIAILIGGSILMFGGLLAIGILLFAATPELRAGQDRNLIEIGEF